METSGIEIQTLTMTAGDRQARGPGFRARAEDRHRARGQERPRLVGPLRGPGQAEAAARARRVHHRQDREGAREPQDPQVDPRPVRR